MRHSTESKSFREAGIIRRAIVTLVPVLLVFCACENAWAKKIHLIIVADTDDADQNGNRTQVARDVQKDLTNINRRFSLNVPYEQLKVYELKGKQVTRDGILRAIRRVPSTSDDAIVFAYGGHGLFDKSRVNGREKGHALKLYHGGGTKRLVTISLGGISFQEDQSKLLYRSELLREIQKKPARFKFIWTDCCNTEVTIKGADTGGAMAARSGNTVAAKLSPLFKSLFMDSKGIVDLATSAPGEMAYGENPPSRGGIATVALCAFLRDNRKRTLSWDDAFIILKQKIGAGFTQHYPKGFSRASLGLSTQKTQTLHRFKWQLGSGSQPSTRKGPRFGVRVQADPQGRGVVITEIARDTADYKVPARKVSAIDAQGRILVVNGVEQTGELDLGDIITHINGVRVRTEAKYAAEVDKSGQLMRFKILNAKGNYSSVALRVQLRW